MLSRDNGGSVSLEMAIQTMTAACKYKNNDLYVVYTLRASLPPVPAPTVAPTSNGDQATILNVNMTVAGLAGLTPDVGLAFEVAMATTLNVSVPLNGSTVASVSQPVVLSTPSFIFGAFQPTEVNITSANTTRRELATTAATTSYILGMSITLLSQPSLSITLKSLQAMQAAISENFPANFNTTQAAMGLGLGFLNITHMASTSPQMYTMNVGPTSKPVSSNFSGQAPASPWELVAGVVIGVLAFVAIAACLWFRRRTTPKVGKDDDDTSGISMPRASQLEMDRAGSRNSIADIIPRISSVPTRGSSAHEWISQRGSTIHGTSNPLVNPPL